MGEFQNTMPKIFNPPVTFDVIVAEQGGRSLAGSLNIINTGYVRSQADNCFQPDKGSKCGDLFLFRIKDIWEQINARQEIQSKMRHWDNSSNFGIGTHTSECFMQELQNTPKCEFTLTYTISESSPPTVVLPVDSNSYTDSNSNSYTDSNSNSYTDSNSRTSTNDNMRS